MKRLACALLVLVAVGCRCKDEPAANSPVTDTELKALLAKQPSDGCTTYQVVEGADGKKALECVELKAADSGS